MRLFGLLLGATKDAEIFSLAGSGKASQIELFEKGYRNFKDIPEDGKTNGCTKNSDHRKTDFAEKAIRSISK